MNKGFTIIELTVVTSIIVIVTAFLVTDFSRSKIDLNEAALTSLDAVREAQTDAQSGIIFKGKYRCGYGIHFDTTSYTIYAGPDAKSVNCLVQDRNYNPGVDEVVRQETLKNIKLTYTPSVDVFFEPPNPTTYLGGSSAAGVSTLIPICLNGTDCQKIYVSTSGQNELQ